VRVVSGAERTLIASEHFVPYIRVEIGDQNGDWLDVSDLNDRDYFTSATWRDSVDVAVMSGTVTLAREVDGESIAPTIAAAIANHPDGGAYDPLIRGRQWIRISKAIKAPGVPPVSGDFVEIFLGRVDSPQWGGNANELTLPIADLGTWLMSRTIDTERNYGTEAGVPIEDVMQQILDDNVVTALGPVTLFVPVSPGVNINEYTQARVPVLQALRDLAQQLAWEVRYRYDVDGVFKLTLYEPDRDKDVADAEFGPDEYLELPVVGINTDDIRNKIRVYYIDSATGERAYQEYEDAASIALNDVGYLEIGESATSQINTAAEALGMATGIGKDLSTPIMSQQMLSMFTWFAQLGDLYNFLPNGVHYDEAQALAVTGVEHALTRDSMRTTLDVRGKPAGQYANWIQLAHTSTGRPIERIARPGLSAFVHDDTRAVDAIVDVDALTTSVKVAASLTHVPTLAEVRATATIATGGASRVTVLAVIAELVAGATGYISALAYDASGNESPIASVAVSSATAEVVGEPTVDLIVATPNNVTGLTVDVALRVVVPSGEAATLYLWLNHDVVADPAYSSTAEYSLAIPAGATEAAPYIVDETVDFTNYPSGIGTFKALNDLRVHPTQFKIIYAKVRENVSGRESGQVPFTVRGGGGFLDANGNLKPGAIFTPSQIVDGLLTQPKFVSTLRIPQTGPTFPGSGTVGDTFVLQPSGVLYRWNGSTWTADVAAGLIAGVLSTTQIPTLGTSNLDADFRIPTFASSLPGSGTSDQILIVGGRQYKWNGSSWVDVASAGFLSGQLIGAQIADLAVSTPKIALGAITSPLVAAGVITADKLFVYSSRGAALNADPNTSDASAWFDEAVGGGTTTITTFGTGGKVGGYAVGPSASGVAAYIKTREWIPIDPLKVYRLHAWIYNSAANGTLYLGVTTADGAFNGTAMSGGGGFYGVVAASPPNGAWTEYVCYVGAGQVRAIPADGTTQDPVAYTSGAAKWMKPYALLNYGGTAGQMFAQDFRLEEVAPGTLIQNGSITTQKVAALAITSDLLAANSATFGKVAAGAIGVDQMRANSIGTTQLIAGAITSDKLYVTGGLGQALNADPSLRDATAWYLGDASIVSLTDGISGNTAIRTTVGGFGNILANASIPFDRNKVYRFHVWLRRSAAAPGYFYYGGTFRNGDGTPSNTNGGYIYAAHSGESIPAADTWYEYNGTLSVGEGSVPSSAAYFYPILYLNYPVVGTAGYVEAQDFRVEEVLPGTLIKDGTITTQKIGALQITSDLLSANAATFGKVAAGAIGVDQMRANSVGADQIIAGQIQADKLIVTWAPGGAINLDPMTSDSSAWTIDAGPGIATVTGKVGNRALFSGVGTQGWYRSRQVLRLDWVHKTYRIHGWVFRSADANGILYLGVNCYRKSDGAALGGVYAPGGASPALGAWTEYATRLDAATFATWSQDPDNVGDAQLVALLNYTGTTGYYYLQDFRIEEVQPGTLIKDGSIVTQHLTSTTVTAGVMSISSLQSISSNLGIIVSGQLNGPGGMFLNLNATGSNPVLHGTQFNLNADGTAVFAGTLSAAGGSFGGTLSAATGSFSGSLSAATGSFAGTLSAATGSFSGTLSAATGSFAGDISGASGTFSGAISSSSFTTGYAAFGGRIELRGTLRLLADSGYADAGDGGILFYRSDFGYVYGKLQMDAASSNITLQANGALTLDAGAGSNNLAINAYAVTINSNYNALATMFQISNSTYGALFTVDVPTNNNDTGLSVIYRNESGAYSFKRIRGDNTNTGGSGNRNLRVLN
jgi:hypothetical protein